MKKFLILCFAALTFAGCETVNFAVSSINPATDIPTQHEITSYELYSWYLGSDKWAFVLFESATRVPAFEEIATSPNAVVGAEPMAEKLLALAPGTKVYWNLKKIKGVTLPDQQIINTLQTAARRRGISLEVIDWPL